MNKLILIKPSEEYMYEISAYRQSFIEHDSHFNGDSGLEKFENISEWINHCRLMENKETVPNPNWVEAEQFMLIRKGTKRILGMINFRHHLNDYLAEYGGHIGYGVCPTERRKGYAKVMLTLCLEKCLARGLDKVLITCEESNEASRRTILSCGGKFERKAVEGTSVLERYWITLKDKINAIAYCGLACCVCSENKDCTGCQDGGCEIHGWCKNYNCCKEKGLNGCWECAEFPCGGSMLDKPRIRAFAEFAKRYGADELEKCLLRNKEKGIVYHYEGQLVGDYDKCQSEEEVIEMIKTGENFFIRSAVLEDAPKCADIHMRSWIFAYSQYIPMEIIEQHNVRRPAMWEKVLKNNVDTHFVVIYQNKIIGIVSINPPRDKDLSDSVYELTGLYLDPDYIGQGFGKKTMDWVKNEISTRGYRKISLWVLSQNTRAKTFYEKNGFKPYGNVKSSGLGDTFEERYICEIDE